MGDLLVAVVVIAVVEALRGFPERVGRLDPASHSNCCCPRGLLAHPDGLAPPSPGRCQGLAWMMMAELRPGANHQPRIRVPVSLP
jgi:hypothetical protein